MRILRLKLRGAIGIKKGLGVDEVEIDFTKFSPGLIALTGRNGSGKTTIMENLHPYRTMVSRDGSLQNHFFLKDSYRVLEFVYGDDIYESKILIDGLTGASEAYLTQHEIGGHGWVPLNDGKLTTYDQSIEKLLGSQDLFFNSVFSGQKSKGIAELKPADRRKLFYELLNLNSYEVYLERSKDQLKGNELKLAQVDGEIKAVTAQIPARTIQELVQEKKETLELVDVKTNEIELFNTSIIAINNEIQTLQVKARVLEDKQNQNDEIWIKINNLEEDIHLLTDGHNRNVAEQIGLIAEYRGIIRSYENKVLDKKKIESGLQAIEDLTCELNSLQEKRRELLELNGKIQQEYSEANQALKKRESYLEELRREKITAENNYKNAVRSVNEASKDSEILDSVPCDEATGFKCTFLSNAHASKKNLDFFESEERRLALQLKNVENLVSKNEKEIRSEKEMIEERYKVAKSKVEGSELHQQIHNLNYEIELLKKNDFPSLAKQLQDSELNFVLYKEKIASAESIIEQFKNSFEKSLVEIKNRIEELTKQIDNEIESKIDTISEQIIARQNDLKSIQDEKCNADNSLMVFKNIITQLEHDIEIAKKNQLLLTQLESEKNQVEADIREWNFLCKAFDKTGIPVLKLENSGIEITSIANDLLSLFENKFRIVFETTSLTKDKKKTKETFDINIIEEDGVCEIGNKSGGQQVWLETAIQLAIMILLSSQGKKVETAFLDEKDGALDLDNAFAYIEMLKRAHTMSGVHNTFVITHRTELLDFIPQQVKLINGILEVIN